MIKNAVIINIAIRSPIFVDNKWNTNFLFSLSNQSVGGKTIGVRTVKIEKLIVGEDK